MEPLDQMQVNPYATIAGIQDTSTSLAPPSYSAMQQPVDPGVQQLQAPTNNPAEIEQRKEGWLEVIKRMQADPNVMRAVGMFGAAAMSARQPGQSKLGHLGQAFMIGQSAYDFGKQAELDQRMRMSKEQRDQAESDARVASTRAATEGQVLQNETTRATMQDTIAKARLARQQAEEQLAGARSDNEKKRIELNYTRRLETLKNAIPDATIQKSIEAEYAAAGLRNDLTRSQIKQADMAAVASGASAGASAANARLTNMKADAIRDLSPEDQRAYILGIGKYANGGAGSAQVQLQEYFKGHWTVANPKGATETEEAYKARQSKAVLDHMQTVRNKGTNEEFLKFIELNGVQGESIDASIKRYQEWRTAMDKIGNPSASPAAPKPTGGAPAVSEAQISQAAIRSWGSYDPSKYQYRIAPDGVIERISKTQPIRGQ